jgi:hypothetical protein
MPAHWQAQQRGLGATLLLHSDARYQPVPRAGVRKPARKEPAGSRWATGGLWGFDERERSGREGRAIDQKVKGYRYPLGGDARRRQRSAFHIGEIHDRTPIRLLPCRASLDPPWFIDGRRLEREVDR